MADNSRVILLRNAVTNWATLFFNIAVALYLTPLVIHKLGKEIYGVWVLLISITTYFQMLDFGMTGAMKRYIAHHNARDEYPAICTIISISFIFYLAMAVFIVLATYLIYLFLLPLLKIPPALFENARLCVLLLGLDIALIIVFNIFSGLLWGLQRFDLTNYIQMISLTGRTAAFIWLLNSGYGIIAMAIAMIGSNLLSHAAKYVAAKILYPQFSIRYRNIQWSYFKKIFSYSMISFLSSLCLFADRSAAPIIIGFFYPPVFVAYYSIAMSLSQYLESGVSAVSGVIMPMVSHLKSKEENGKIEGILIKGTKYLTLLTIVGSYGLIVFGESFVNLWIGEEFAIYSTPVLIVLALSSVFSLPQNININILNGSGYEKDALKVVLARSISYLVLSSLLCIYWGIFGFAIGVLVIRLIFHILILPQQTTKILRCSCILFLEQSMLKPLLPSIFFLLVGLIYIDIGCYDSFIFLSTWAILCTMTYAVASFYLALNVEERFEMLSLIKRIKYQFGKHIS